MLATRRWNSKSVRDAKQGTIATDDDDDDGIAVTPSTTTPKPSPKDTINQVLAVTEALAAASRARDETALAERFSSRGRGRERLPKILDTLVAFGRARVDDRRYSSV